MLKYLIILLDKTCPSFCHYSVPECEPSLISVEHLKKAVRFAMVENLNVQYVMPNYQLPVSHQEIIDGLKGSKISEYNNCADADVFIINDPYKLPKEPVHKCSYVIRLNQETFKDTFTQIVLFATAVQKVNIVFTDEEKFNSNRLDGYKKMLDEAVEMVKSQYLKGRPTQINILTDRLLLDEMNNCNAGWESVAVGPDGGFYVCPAFFYDSNGYCIGDLDTGLKIRNPQLYRLDHAPICRDCDAYHCKRCIWLNRRLTREVGIPSKQQCEKSHVERNASKVLLESIREYVPDFIKDRDIPEIDYIDPFEVKLKENL